MRKPTGKLNELRADKKGDINRTEFNFLENLLVFRTMEELVARPEGGRKFRISRKANGHGICLLIHIDDRCYPVMEEGVPRPDYLAVYLHGNGCICTIIEMKGRDEGRLEHGLEQIKTLAEKLGSEFKRHLHSNLRPLIQGILVCPFGAHSPNSLITKMAKGGLTIRPVLCSSCAELYPYISKDMSKENDFQNVIHSPAPPGKIEKMMSQDALKKRILAPPIGLGNGDGLHIDFVLSEKDEYATLITRARKCVFVVSGQGDQHRAALQADIDANMLGKKFSVEAAPQ